MNKDSVTGRGGGGAFSRHPVLFNLALILAAALLLGWASMWFLDFWTFHGQERTVPDVKDLPYTVALDNIDRLGLHAQISDSVFDQGARPGTVVEQIPIPEARIKRGGTVYLTIVAFTPKLVTMPDFYNVSSRQARSMLEGLGLKNIRQVEVPSEYAGLVLGAKFNGVALTPGARVPLSAVITLEVGAGYDEEAEAAAGDSLGAAIDDQLERLDLQ